jgi:hypothetical protein
VGCFGFRRAQPGLTPAAGRRRSRREVTFRQASPVTDDGEGDLSGTIVSEMRPMVARVEWMKLAGDSSPRTALLRCETSVR